MTASQDFKFLQEKIQTTLVSTTRSSNQIAAEDLSFHRTSNPTVAEELDDTSSRLLTLSTSLLKAATKSTDGAAPDLEDADDVDVHWSRIVDVIDTLLEKADTCLDEYTGAIKRKLAPTEPSAPPSKKSRFDLDHSMRRANVLKPQNAFEVKPNNDHTAPWKPLLTQKPHATLPLQKSLGTFNNENQSTQYKHPYETEILNLEYPDAVFQQKEPTEYLPFESTSAIYVDTYEGVLEMLQELKGASEIAVDAEHHDFRTFSGLLSLMQISTRDKDWIVDTLQPWRHKLEVLNEVFADPKILKVFHGAYMDIIWLQRDLGLYIVGLFDTHEAAVILNYPGKSLAYLLKRFVDFDADKKYQLADWRIRPIPDEMLYYARSDTHYLLYIYDMIRNELLQTPSADAEQSPISQVLDRSKGISLRRYENSAYDAEGGLGPFGWYNMLLKYSSGKLSREQFSVFRAVHKWRDETARQEDESPLYVMNNGTVFDIARRMPPDPKALHSLIQSGSHTAKRAVAELFRVIAQAKADGANGPTVAEALRGQAPPTTVVGEVAQAIIPQLASNKGQVLDTKDMISHTSRLWGKVPLSSRWEQQPKTDAAKGLQFELPWSQFIQSAQVMEEATKPTVQSTAPDEQFIPLSGAEKVAQEKRKSGSGLDDSEFTLRTGLKRKVPEVDSESEHNGQNTVAPELASASAMDTDEIAVPDSSEEERAEKKARKAEKKARKKARKELQKANSQAKPSEASAAASHASGEGEAEDDDDDEPFDYSKAKSVLKPGRNGANGNGTQQKAKFNPYGLTADGPKPARRMHGEKAGKSATFKK